MRSGKKKPVAFCQVLCLLAAISMLASSSAVAQTRSKPADLPVTISPPKVTLLAGEIQVFSAQVGDGAAVAWSVDEENGGAITTSGVYTAPKVQGIYHVTATSVANPEKKVSATITVCAYYDPPTTLVRW